MVDARGMGETCRAFPALYLLALGGGAISIGLLNVWTTCSARVSFPGGYLAAVRDETSLIIFN